MKIKKTVVKQKKIQKKLQPYGACAKITSDTSIRLRRLQSRKGSCKLTIQMAKNIRHLFFPARSQSPGRGEGDDLAVEGPSSFTIEE